MASSYGSDAGKSALRKEYLQALQSYTTGDKGRSDSQIISQLEQVEEFKRAPLVLTYVSTDFEVDTKALIKKLLRAGRRVAVPRMEASTSTCSFYELSDFSELTGERYGILEPDESCKLLNPLEMANSVCLVPGLSFDAAGHRLGRGGGYYDKFLSFYPGHKIALVRRLQISNNPLPTEAHDIAVDIMVSENGYWYC